MTILQSVLIKDGQVIQIMVPGARHLLSPGRTSYLLHAFDGRLSSGKQGRQMPVSLEMNGKRRDLEIGTRTRTPAG